MCDSKFSETSGSWVLQQIECIKPCDVKKFIIALMGILTKYFGFKVFIRIHDCRVKHKPQIIKIDKSLIKFYLIRVFLCSCDTSSIRRDRGIVEQMTVIVFYCIHYELIDSPGFLLSFQELREKSEYSKELRIIQSVISTKIK